MRRVKFWIVAGMLPVKELKDKSSKVRLGDREEGILPVKLLF